MTVKTYLWGMTASTLVSFAAWAVVLENVDPSTAKAPGFALFYLTLLFALTCLFSLGGFFLRRKIFEDRIEFRQAEAAFRQGALLALTFVGLLVLQGQRQLSLYTAFFFVLVVVGVECYFLLKR